jgi:hypothetical protein
VVCVGDEGSAQIEPEAKVGDTLHGLAGIMDYSGGEFCMQLRDQPQVIPSFPSSLPTPRTPGFDAVTINLADLFDAFDDPLTADEVLSGSEYQLRLQKRAQAIHDVFGEPALLAVQEVENDQVLRDLLLRPEFDAEYEFTWENGPDLRGLDVALLYRSDRVILLESRSWQGCTTMVDGLGPDGNQDVHNPVNAITCDANGDGLLDGNRLFSRQPLVVDALVCAANCQTGRVNLSPDATLAGDPEYVRVTLVINHWKSKKEDTQTTQYSLPRRVEEAEFIAARLQEILAEDAQANLIVLGDLNDLPGSQPLGLLGMLDNQILRLPKNERYTFIHRGRSQVLDYILTRTQPGLAPLEAYSWHTNADYPSNLAEDGEAIYRISDHDSLAVHFQVLERFIYLPAIRR